MTDRLIRGTLVLAFSAALGHLAFGVFGPSPDGKYFVGGRVTALGAPDMGSRQAYLRRSFFLSERPRHAWVQVVGRDKIRVFVNGHFVGGMTKQSFGAAVVEDITRYLQRGPNVIAIDISQKNVSLPPLVSVDAGYVIGEAVFRIGADRQWRCRERIERGAGWWFETDFDDRHWQAARLTEDVLRARVDYPPSSATSPGTGHWMTTSDFDPPVSCVRREFEIDGPPRQAWLRLTTNAHYRLAINGVVVDVQEEGLGLGRPVRPVERVYDITTLLRPGSNVVGLLLSRAGGRPQLLADMQVEDHRGRIVAVGSDELWQSHPGISRDWLSVGTSQPAAWRNCSQDSTLAVAPWNIPRKIVDVVLPWDVYLGRIQAEIALMLVIAVATYFLCNRAALILSRLLPASTTPGRWHNTVFLCLLLPTLAIAVAVLLTFDPRVDPRMVYRAGWLILAVFAVFVGWGLLALVARASPDRAAGPKSSWPGRGDASLTPRHPLPTFFRTQRFSATGVVLAGLMLVGFCLRVAGVADNPLHPDETTMYRAVQGLLECGFPRVRIHENLPPSYVATSEAVYYGPALAELFFDDPRYVIRMPSVCFGTATILLMFFVGRGLFGTTGGLVGASLYAFAPIPISTTNFGRYFSQLQFFTLLTVYLYYRTIAVTTPHVGFVPAAALARIGGQGTFHFLAERIRAAGRHVGFVPAAALARIGGQGTFHFLAERTRAAGSPAQGGSRRDHPSGGARFGLTSRAGLVDGQMLALTTASFILTYLSWEGVAVIVPGMLLAFFLERRGHLKTAFRDRRLWLALFVVMLVVVLQHSHRALHQVGTLWYGTGARDISLTPMWHYPQFDLTYYVYASSWQQNAFLPLLGLVGAALLATGAGVAGESPPEGRGRLARCYPRQLRYLSLIFYTNCFLFSLVMPVRAGRYAYHLVPLVILLNAGCIAWVAGRLYKFAADPEVPGDSPAPGTPGSPDPLANVRMRYGRGLIVTITTVVVAVASGLPTVSEELRRWNVSASVPGELRVADQRAATRFLLEHLQQGDVVLAITPHVVEHEWKLAAARKSAAKGSTGASSLAGAVHYWIESRMQLQPALDDIRTVTLHRLSGTHMIATVEELETVFARNKRIWYLTSPGFHGRLNTSRVSSFLRQHMDVVYEDYQSMLLFRDANHRPASIRVRDEEALSNARTRILP